MARLPKVVSPLLSLGQQEGVDLVLVSVELWEDEVVVRLRGLPSELTARLDTDFHEALDAWHRAGAKARVPPQPAEGIFPDVFLSDDVGTAYGRGSSSRGGSGTMFRADYTFRPGPPNEATVVSVRIGTPDDAGTQIAI